MLRRLFLLSLTLGAQSLLATTIVAEEGIDFFESRIRPVLADKCYSCHSVAAEGRKKLKAALYLDSKEGVLKGGDTGPALVPGDPDKSLLIKAIRYHDDDTAMPPKEKLPDPVIADFEHWVRIGAPDPRSGANAPKAGQAIAEQTKKHWAFQPLVAPQVPVIASGKHAEWAVNQIDHFILSQLVANTLMPTPQADKRTLIRRATFDLIGLPPTADEVAEFEKDQSPNAFAKVIDRLLATPAYGERWGRHWLDVARYADSKGYVFKEDRAYPYAYAYRDWVVQAFNDDLPYQRFLQLQLAADRLVDWNGPEKHHLAAMGFMTVGRRFLNNTHDIIDDRIDVLSRGTMGLTIACSRCHDHKFDPIPTKDYYALYGVFASSEEPSDLPIIGSASDPKQTTAYEQEMAKREQARDEFRAKQYTERLKELRGAELLAKYLLAAQDAQGKDDDARNQIINTHSLERAMFNRWRSWIEKIDAKHPVFAPWKALAGVPDKEFAHQAKTLLAALSSSDGKRSLNPLAVAALVGKEPKTRYELAKWYGALLAAHDGEQKHDDDDREAIRQLLRREGAPTAVPFDKADEVLNGNDEKQLRDRQKKIDELASQHPGAPMRAMILKDRGNPHNVRVFIRGQPGNHGEEAPRRFLTFLSRADAKSFSDGSGRLELARAITDPANPLTARVMVNRVWAWHFGAGIVRTPSDFGLRTEAPVHGALLDWLAAQFIADGWSVKKLHRLIMLSATYRQSANAPDASSKRDPENALFSRFNRQRLGIEAMRDALLFASGRLDRSVGGKSVDLLKEPFSGRRTLYGTIDRQNLPGTFRSFDFANPDAHTPQRFITTVPQQALYLMNSPFAIEQARGLAKRSHGPATTEARVQQLYRLTFARAATKDEVKLGTDFITAQVATPAQEATPIWLYGYGAFDPAARTLRSFTRLPTFKDNAWRGGDTMPDDQLGFVSLTATGGHPGNSHAHAVVRRFTAPHGGTFTISGTLKRLAKEGDGVRALVLIEGQPPLGEWEMITGEIATAVHRVQLKAGQTLDFVVDGKGNSGWDRFSWSPQIAGIDGTNGTWNAADGFTGPQSAKQTLDVWERYAQALLMTNEFVFVD